MYAMYAMYAMINDNNQSKKPHCRHCVCGAVFVVIEYTPFDDYSSMNFL